MFSYPSIADDVDRSNDNATIMSFLSIHNKLLVVNNAKTSVNHFISQKTFRRQSSWMSEIDTSIVFLCLLDRLTDFCVLQHLDVPSDRAPAQITLSIPAPSMENILH